MQTLALPDEFALLAACCRWPLTADALADVQRGASGAMDWECLVQLAERHRVGALVHHALHAAGIAVPGHAWDRLAEQSQTIARQNLALAAETVRLQRQFESVGTPVLTLKGLALAQRAYGSIGLKHGRDIDLLVAQDHALGALRLLEKEGYALVDPAPQLSDRQRHAFVARGYEFDVGNGKGIRVELHWRLTENRHLMHGVDPFAAAQAVQLPGGTVRTLDDAALFAYLCVHGANHCWFRLKWLVDLSALLGQSSDARIEELYRYAQARGAGVCAAQALLLCERLLGRRLPPDLSRELHADNRVGRLVSIAVRKMLAWDAAAVPAKYGERFKEAAYRFLLGRSPRFLAAQLAAVLVAPADVLICQLPRPLWFLYPVIRLPSWLVRRFTRPASQRTGGKGQISSRAGHIQR